MRRKRIAILGPIPRDTIKTFNGEVLKKYGCVTHTAIVMSKLLEDSGIIYPVSHVKKVDYQEVLNIFKPFNNINTTHITCDFDQGDVIFLEFLDENKRIEKQTAFMNPILPSDVKDLLDCDVFVMVPVTDFEVPLETLKYIKANSNASILFDAHGPTNTLTISGDRYMKVWVDRDCWLPYIDILKMNLEEAHCSWFAREFNLEEIDKYNEVCKEELPNFAMHCFEKGVRAVYVTLDSRGVLVFSMVDDKLHQEIVKSIPVEKVIDTTGCGDSFAGGLGYSLMVYKEDYIKAAQYGNAMGAQRTQGKTFDVFLSLKETERMIANNYTI